MPLVHLGSQRSLVGLLPNMHGQHPVAATGPRTIFSKGSGLLPGTMFVPVPRYCYGRQKRLLPSLWVTVMALHRLEPSSMCIKGKACVLVGSNY